MKYLHLRLEELMAEHGYTKKKVCSAIDIERTNFNRYYRDEFQRIDANLILKLCEFFNCEPGDLFEIREKQILIRRRATKALPFLCRKQAICSLWLSFVTALFSYHHCFCFIYCHTSTTPFIYFRMDSVYYKLYGMKRLFFL